MRRVRGLVGGLGPTECTCRDCRKLTNPESPLAETVFFLFEFFCSFFLRKGKDNKGIVLNNFQMNFASF